MHLCPNAPIAGNKNLAEIVILLPCVLYNIANLPEVLHLLKERCLVSRYSINLMQEVVPSLFTFVIALFEDPMVNLIT